MNAVALDLDAVLADTRPLWHAWLVDAARRYRSIADLQPDELPHDRSEAAAELDRWASAGIGDWRASLHRFSEDHVSLYLRPDAETNAILRELHEAGVRVGVFSDAPEPLARVVVAQLGVSRRLSALATGVGALERLLGALGDGAVLVRSRNELKRAAERHQPRSPSR